MKVSATTTQIPAAPGNAFQRRTPSDSHESNGRAPSPEDDQETGTHFEPPTYDGLTALPVEEKDASEAEVLQASGSQSNATLENHSPVVHDYPRTPPDNASLPLEEPGCDLLPNRPAVWIVKGRGLKISSLAASILLNDGILTSKDLALQVSRFVISVHEFH
jgi:hypothetical protein